ncbi:HAD family hydrolase [Pseudomonas sp. SDO524_S393]
MYPSAVIGELPSQGALPRQRGAPKLVIFDCDGVLVQSEEITLSVLISMLNAVASTQAPASTPLHPDPFIERFRGRRIAECLKEAEHILNIRLDQHFEVTYRQQSLDALARNLKATEGIHEVLDKLPMNYCVASSAPRAKIEQCLQLTGLFSYFEGRVFSCYELGRWKPDPLVFLTACAAHQVDVGDALVVEDSVTGIQAAVAAGIKVLGFGPPDRHALLARAGAMPFSDMRELPTLF